MATIEETKRMMEVMQAYVEGKPIQVASTRATSLVWVDVSAFFAWDWSNYSYRVKPDYDAQALTLYADTAYGKGTSIAWSDAACAASKTGLRAVIDAVKRGELE